VTNEINPEAGCPVAMCAPDQLILNGGIEAKWVGYAHRQF
jgi:hypothetical protein